MEVALLSVGVSVSRGLGRYYAVASVPMPGLSLRNGWYRRDFGSWARRAAYCSTKRFTPCSFLARSMKSFMMVLASKTGGDMRYTAVIGEVLVAVMKGLDHVVRSSQSNLTVGWTVAAVAEDADREAMRKGVDEAWHSLAMHEPTLPVPPVMSIVPFGEGDMVKVVRHRVVDPALLRVLVVSRGLSQIYIELYLACNG